MIEKLIESTTEQSRDLLKLKGIVRSFRHRLEIELGGTRAQRDKEHAEDLRVQINDCFDAEKFLQKGLDNLAEIRAALQAKHAPEQTLEQALNRAVRH